MRYTSQFRRDIRLNILKRISSGSCVSVLGLPGLGKSDFIGYLVSSCNQENNGNTCINLDVNDLVHISDTDFFKQLLTLLIDHTVEIKNPSPGLTNQLHIAEELVSATDTLLIFNTIKKLIQEILNESTKSIGIFIDGFSKLQSLPVSFFNSLRALRSVNKFRIAYVFIDDMNLISILSSDQIGDLYDLITSHIVWIPLPSEEESLKIINNSETLAHSKFSVPLKQKIYWATKGHASLTKYLVLYLSEQNLVDFEPEQAIKDIPLTVRIEKLLNPLSDEERALLEEVAKGKIPDVDYETSALKTLTECYLISKNPVTGEFSIFSPLVTAYLTEQARINPSKPVTKKDVSKAQRIKIVNGNVLIEDKTIEDDLTETEFRILELLLSQGNSVVKREAVAEIMWGSESGEKYSDWAIDRAISRLRKKIGDNAYRPQYIKTLRGRGFKLTP